MVSSTTAFGWIRASLPMSAPRPGAQPLSAVGVGRTARVDAIAAPNPRIGRRLEALGFVPGSRVTVVRRAPLGDPVEYEVRGSRICLRASEAACIRVVPE
jgi:Fe2+ transport system protein FeoA